MFKILICEESLTFNYQKLFPLFDITLAYCENDILDFTYENSYDLYIINTYFYNTIKELKDMGDRKTTIFIDKYYSITNLKKTFLIGDDYMVKPLIFEELQIRVDYHYRKLFQTKTNIIKYKNFFYHSSSMQLYLKNKKVKLSPNETKITQLLLINLNKPVSKDIIYETLESYSNGSLRVHISKLKKIGLNITYNRSIQSYYLQ